MSLSREELVARSLLHANTMTGGSLTLPAMLDNNQFQQLSPEEKAAVVEQYATLSKTHPASHQVPTLGSTIAHGAKAGLIGSVLPTILAGVIAVPTVAAISASMGNRVAMMDILRRTATPLAIAGGIGMASGVVGHVLGRAMTSDNNNYISKLVKSVQEEQDPDERRIKSMALVAASPTLNRRGSSLDMAGVNLTQQIIGNYLGSDQTQDMFNKAIRSHSFELPNGARKDFTYKDFNYLEGMDRMINEPNARPAFKIVPNV